MNYIAPIAAILWITLDADIVLADDFVVNEIVKNINSEY